MSDKTLMEQYEDARHAEYELEEAVINGTSGPDWWRDGGPGLPFHDWYFDTYDLSVELVGAKVGWFPTAENLAAYLAAGIRTVFVSYEGAKPDSYGKDSAWMWFYRDGRWKNGSCSARRTDENRSGLVGELKRRLAGGSARDPL